MDVRSNLKTIEENIERACEKVNRKREEITIIGVTKYVTIERTEEAIRAGITNIGENRAEELTRKYNSIDNEATWHFIGTLQSRKVKDVIDKINVIHSLDRLSVAKQIDKRANSPIECFIQVNVSGEESKHGLSPEETLPFIKQLESYEKVRVVGLMTMAPHVTDEALLRKVFRDLAELRDSIQREQLAHAPCAYLSMGMSNDYELAIEEGATHIRIGSKLVGTNET
ncbi:YggS family pyridoxal phosphate-dependent enzyme [Virgibacillus sp. W0430]|uniref:YggS family pyridoxal phosphate-dependent enzyme n=1 Tax=Virgibacillus sp. W0430 TaxID=3391580 RepID=UPI003F449D8D